MIPWILVVCAALGANFGALADYAEPLFVYHNHDNLTTYLRSVAEEYPRIAHLYSIGQSVEGRELWVLAMAAEKPDKHVKLRPEVKYVGNMHGNEAVSRELLIHFIHYVINGFNNNDDDVTDLMTSARIHIMVSMNPDGFEHTYETSDMGTCFGVVGRYNANGLDLNRNFPDFFRNNTAPIQPETQAVIEWLATEQFVLSANLHGGALVANYPYDNNVEGQSVYTATQDDDVFQELSRVYSLSHANMFTGSHCGFNFIDGITNGAEWYAIIGSMQDYNYIFEGCMELTLEVSCCKYPNESTLEGYWNENRASLLNLLHQVNIGVKGVVTGDDGIPIEGALVSVEGRDDHYLETTVLGEYWKLLLPGDYILQVSAVEKTMSVPFTITTRQMQPFILNVAFLDDPTPPSKASNGQYISVYWLFLACYSQFLALMCNLIY